MHWEQIAHGAGVRGHATSSTHSELHALRSGLAYLLSLKLMSSRTRKSKRGI